jgi:hypothetical protein
MRFSNASGALWVELSKTPKTSPRYEVLADKIRAEAGPIWLA